MLPATFFQQSFHLIPCYSISYLLTTNPARVTFLVGKQIHYQSSRCHGGAVFKHSLILIIFSRRESSYFSFHLITFTQKVFFSFLPVSLMTPVRPELTCAYENRAIFSFSYFRLVSSFMVCYTPKSSKPISNRL